MSQTTLAVAVAAAFDLSKYELVDSKVFTVKDKGMKEDLIGADGKNPAQVRLFSPGSPQGVAAQHEYNRAQGLRMGRTMTGQVLENDAELAEQEETKRLVGFTAEWINFPVRDSTDVYANPRLIYITRQVQANISKYGNF